MSHRTADRATRDRVVASFQVEGPRIVSPIEAGNRNDNFVVEDGAGQRYVLRHFRRNPDVDRIAFELTFQSFAFRHGVPVPRVVPTRTGANLLDDASGLWALFSYIEGTELDFAAAPQIAGAAAALAGFHRMTAAFRGTEVPGRGGPSVRRWWTEGERLLTDVEEFFAGRGVAEELTFLHRWHAELLDAWPLDRLDGLPASWVHGDFHGRNIAFAGDTVSGIFDFDLLHFGYPIEDVADAMCRFGREARGALRVRPERARKFVEAYDGLRPLTDVERAAVPIMAPLVLARDGAYYRLIAADGGDPVAFLREKVRIMRARSEQGHDLERAAAVR